MSDARGAPGHDGRRDSGDPRRCGGAARGSTASDSQRQRSGVRGDGGAVIPGVVGLGDALRAPASPWQNNFAESFHSKLRDEFLNCEDLESVAQAQALADLWREEYNTERHHSSLKYRTPAEFAATCVRYVPIEEDALEPTSTEQTYSLFPLWLDQEMGSRPPN